MNDVPHLRVTSSLVINQECTLLDTGLEGYHQPGLVIAHGISRVIFM